MHWITKLSLITLILATPFYTSKAQGNPLEKAEHPETVSIASIHSGGTLYFKARIQGLKKDVQLILEKEVPGKEDPVVVDVQKGVGTKADIPILYCFKDENPDSKATSYRLKKLHFDKERSRSVVLAEKSFDNLLLSLKKD